MRSIHIKASREYDVLVERGLLDRTGELARLQQYHFNFLFIFHCKCSFC